jgi:hypothetical protein
VLFGLLIVGCVVALPHAISCCSHFSAADLKLRAQFTKNLDPHTTPVAVALLDWPMGFRLLLMTLVAAIICFLLCVIGVFVARADDVGGGRGRGESIKLVLGSLMVGVLYILAAYLTGFIGYVGPANLLWVIGVPAVIAIITWPRPIGIPMALPVGIGGWIALIAICMTVGIPLD